jgi:hypothetical protein
VKRKIDVERQNQRQTGYVEGKKTKKTKTKKTKTKTKTKKTKKKKTKSARGRVGARRSASNPIQWTPTS